jgi:hypothetical protein
LKVKSDFTIILGRGREDAMSCVAHPAAEPIQRDVVREARPMTRCECAEIPFVEIARRLREERLSLDEICCRTGCGQRCTACRPDLEAYLAR